MGIPFPCTSLSPTLSSNPTIPVPFCHSDIFPLFRPLLLPHLLLLPTPVPPQIQLGSGECCKLPSRVRRGASAAKTFLGIFSSNDCLCGWAQHLCLQDTVTILQPKKSKIFDWGTGGVHCQSKSVLTFDGKSVTCTGSKPSNPLTNLALFLTQNAVCPKTAIDF